VFSSVLNDSLEVAAVQAEVAGEFDRIHSIERPRKVGSVDRIISPGELRRYLVEAVERA
jgi:hypothetical protein